MEWRHDGRVSNMDTYIERIVCGGGRGDGGAMKVTERSELASHFKNPLAFEGTGR